MYMPSSTRNNKEAQLIFSPDPASLERSIRKKARSLSTDNNTSVSLDSAQPSSTQTPVPSINSRSPLSTDNTNVPSTDIFHPPSIDIPSPISIDTEPRDMVAPLILVRDNNGDMHDLEGHLRIAADDFWQVVKEEKLQEDDFEVESLVSFGGSQWCRSTPDTEHRSIYTNTNRSTGTREHLSTTPTESTASCNAMRILTHEEFVAKHPYPLSPDKVRIDRHANNNIDRQPSPPIDRQVLITYRVQMPKIDVARLTALRPKPKPPEPVRTLSNDGADPMEEDRVSTGRTLRRRNEKVAKHLKRGANEKEKKSFQKRVFRIPLHKPFEEAFYTHRLWKFFRVTREKEEDIRTMFCEAKEKMRMRITLKKKSDPGKFAIPCTVKGIEFPHALCDTGASVSILPRVMADHLGKKPQTIPRRINDAGIIVACHCGAQYESDYSKLIDTHPFTLIDASHPKSTHAEDEKFVNTCPNEWGNDYYNPTIDPYTRRNLPTDEYDEDYEEERATEYRAIHDEEDKLLHHSSWKKNAPSIDMTCWPSIDIQLQQRCRKRASTDTAYYKSVDTDVNRVRHGDYSIGSWANEHHHGSFEVETIQAEAAWERTHFSHPINARHQQSIDTRHQQSINTRHQQSIDTRPQQSINTNNTTLIDNRPMPKTTVSEKDKLDNQYLTPDEFGIFRDLDGYAKEIDGRTLHKASKESYDTAGGIDNGFIQRSRHTTHPSIYVDVSTSVARQLEFGRRAYDLYAYICLPEHASSFTQTKLVPEIYTKEVTNEMFYGVCGEHERNKEAFQMKFDGVYYPLNDSISWLTTFMEEMKQGIARIQNATDVARPPSTDRRQPDLSTANNHHRSTDTITHQSTTA
ncbi:hypothetical protein F2Q69_00003498 [Brassica cretica]|uniref:Uncharacterized protein n=1 Tax=Brassica cretica TaxID=69181 RepID=A0A8S9P128_BRACR|nr:hypothetical protein F2Q69_00003498 [Brassica cretica]